MGVLPFHATHASTNFTENPLWGFIQHFLIQLRWLWSRHPGMGEVAAF